MNRDVVVEPLRFKGEPKLPKSGLLAVNPTDVRWIQELAEAASLKRHYLFHSQLYSSEKYFLAGPAVGAPMAALCMEKLIALGAKDIIFFGWCGSLTPRLQVGDLLVPGLAVSEEGTSQHYQEFGPLTADKSLCSVLQEGLVRQSIEFQQGSVWTTDAPYRETREKITRYAKQGVLAVDMEFAALCSVASFRKVRFAGLMLVSDELWRTPWKANFANKIFKKRSRMALEALCNLLIERDD